MSYLTTLLDTSHNKDEFSCGKEMLDNYLHKQASQDIRRRLTVVFVLPEKSTIKGYYTLSSNNIKRELVPEDILKKMPRSYTEFPATLLGRLAVDKNFMKQGIGQLLLLDALRRSYDISKTSVGSMAVIVDPLDQEAFNFYLKFGFIELPDSKRMFLPMNIINKLFEL